MNVLKPHQKSTIITLLERACSQHEINRVTGVDRKTIRRYEQLHKEAIPALISNSPRVATGSEVQIPPWPPGRGEPETQIMIPAHARSACESHRVWIEEQVRLKRNALAIFQELVDRHGFKVNRRYSPS